MIKNHKLLLYLGLHGVILSAACSRPREFNSKILTFKDKEEALCTANYLRPSHSKNSYLLLTNSRSDIGWDVDQNGDIWLVLGKKRVNFNERKYNSVIVNGDLTYYFLIGQKELQDHQKLWNELGVSLTAPR